MFRIVTDISFQNKFMTFQGVILVDEINLVSDNSLTKWDDYSKLMTMIRHEIYQFITAEVIAIFVCYLHILYNFS